MRIGAPLPAFQGCFNQTLTFNCNSRKVITVGYRPEYFMGLGQTLPVELIKKIKKQRNPFLAAFFSYNF